MDSNTIWYKAIPRDDLVNLIDRDASLPVLAGKAQGFSDIPVNHTGIIAYWQDDPQRRWTLPDGVILRTEDIEDFIAWVATYLPVRPFTAYCRVLDPRVVRYFANARPASFTPLENCFLGIILAECAKGIGLVDGSGELSLIESAGTLSFSLTRAVALGLEADAARWIGGQWEKARALIPGRRKTDDTSSVLRVFSLVRALGSSPASVPEEDRIILSCAQEIADKGEIQHDSWSKLTSWSPQLSRLSEIQGLPRESRIQVLRKAADLISDERNGRAAFVIGYLGSAVAPGSFEHYRTVLELESKFAGALLWYGMCAGLYRRSDLQFFSEGLGRRIARELERVDSIYSRPYCDVSVSELEVLLRAARLPALRLGSFGTIEIELAPCVTTVRPVAVEQVRQKSENIDSLFRELDYKLQDIDRLRSKIARAVRPPSQRYLYDDSPKERKK